MLVVLTTSFENMSLFSFSLDFYSNPIDPLPAIYLQGVTSSLIYNLQKRKEIDLIFYSRHPTRVRDQQVSEPVAPSAGPARPCDKKKREREKKKRIRRHSSFRHIDNKHIHHVTIRRRGAGRQAADKEAFLLFPLRCCRASLCLLAPISLSATFQRYHR